MTSVSVIIPFYQKECGILSKALASIASQQFVQPVSIDVIIVDDASPTAPDADIPVMPQHISLKIIRRVNGGPGAARNTGLDAVAQGTDYIALLDSDDVWSTDHLQTAVDALGQDADFYFCDHLRPNGLSHFKIACQEIGEPIVAGQTELFSSPQATKRFSPLQQDGSYEFIGDQAIRGLLKKYLAHTSSLVYRWSRFQHLRFDPHLRSAGEDYLFTLCLAYHARKVCFSIKSNIMRGKGLNIYDNAIDWDHPDNLKVLFDNLRCFIRAAHVLPAVGDIATAIRERVGSRRILFVYVLLRRTVITRKLDLLMLRAACREDDGFLGNLPSILWKVALARCRGSSFASVSGFLD